MPGDAELARPDPRRPRYDMAVTVHPGDGGVEGRLRVRFTPDLPTDRLVFRLWPNGPRPAAAGARLDADPVTLDGTEAQASTTRPDPTILVVALGRTLDPGDVVVARMAWRLAAARVGRRPGVAHRRGRAAGVVLPHPRLGARGRLGRAPGHRGLR